MSSVSLRERFLPALKVEPGEEKALFWAAAYFFCVLGSYYVLRPLRDAMGVSGGGDRLSWLFLGTLTGTLLLNPLFGALVSRFPRHVFVPFVYRFLIASLVVFHVLLRTAPPARQKPLAAAFFIWTSVFVMFATSLFWGVMVDLFRSEQGKRLFGVIGAGGTIGGVAGSALTASLVHLIGPLNLFLVAAAIMELGVFCIRRLVAAVDLARTGLAERGGKAVDAPPGRGAWRGAALVFRTPYLLAICGFLLFFTVSSTFLYFEQARIVKATLASAADRTAFFARIDLTVNLLTIATQTFLTARVIGLLGVGGTLGILPAVTLAGFTALWAWPLAATLFAVQTLRRAVEFALIRPSREILFTVVSREEKYASKTFIDTFVYRGGDAVGAAADIGLKAAGLAPGGLAVLLVPVAAAWLGVAAYLGRRQSEKAAELTSARAA